MKSAAEIGAAARRVIHARLRLGVSAAYVCDILDRDPAWADADMADILRVRDEVTHQFDAWLAGLPTPAAPASPPAQQARPHLRRIR